MTLSCLPEDHGEEECLAHPKVAFLSTRTMDGGVCCTSSETLVSGRFCHCFPHVQDLSHLVEFKKYLFLQFPTVTVVGYTYQTGSKTQMKLGLQPGPSPEEAPDYCEYIMSFNRKKIEGTCKDVLCLSVEHCPDSWK